MHKKIKLAATIAAAVCALGATATGTAAASTHSTAKHSITAHHLNRHARLGSPDNPIIFGGNQNLAVLTPAQRRAIDHAKIALVSGARQHRTKSIRGPGRVSRGAPPSTSWGARSAA